MAQKEWNHPLKFVDFGADDEDDVLSTLRVATLNCLATAYTNPSQLSWLPPELLSWDKRKISILAALRTLDCDILCLQECDHYNDGFKEDLEDLGLSTLLAIRPSRLDGCVIAFKASKLEVVNTSTVDFNVLVDLHGGDHKFKKDNIAQLCLFQSLQGTRPFLLVANTHLYWNPLKAEVKLMQAAMLTRKCEELVAGKQITPTCLVCGDLNSLPGSDVVRYLEAGEVEALSPPCDRFLCDSDLNRLCRWLRILGLDAAMESKEESIQRTQHRNFSLLFERTRAEKRLLLTCSKRVVERAECPPCVEIGNRNLHQGIVRLFRYYPIVLDPKLFLTVCVKCNGAILAQKDWGTDETAALDAHQRSPVVNPSAAQKNSLPGSGLAPLFMCSSPHCRQVYWMSCSARSSSMRSKQQAADLHDLICRSRGQQQAQEVEKGAEELATSDLGVAASFYRSKCASSHYPMPKKDVVSGSIEVSDFRAQPAFSDFLRHTLNLRSLFSSSFLEDGPRTKTTSISTIRNNFHGLIDHIFFSESHFRCLRRLELPTVEEMRMSQLGPHASLPCKSWGSDHMVVACDLAWLLAPQTTAQEKEDKQVTK